MKSLLLSLLLILASAELVATAKQPTLIPVPAAVSSLGRLQFQTDKGYDYLVIYSNDLKVWREWFWLQGDGYSVCKNIYGKDISPSSFRFFRVFKALRQ